jgi:hypothetical protein
MKTQIAMIREALVEGVVETQLTAQSRAQVVVGWSRARQFATALAIVAFILMLQNAEALAQRAGCDTQAADKLVGFIESGAQFMIGIGAAGALLMFAVGAAFIIFAGGKAERASKGMGIIKNCVIGLVILAAGAFIKFIVLTFVDGTGANQSSCTNSNDQQGIR